VPELFSTITPDGSVPERDEEAPVVPQDRTKRRSSRTTAKEKKEFSQIQKRSRLVIDDVRMFVFAVLAFGGRSFQQTTANSRVSGYVCSPEVNVL
jgi:hypothetical protein